MQAVENQYQRGKIPVAKQPTRVIAVTSGKGGVGKTQVCVNLGLALTQLGKKVLLLDADLGLANINVLLGFKPGATLHDVISGKAQLKDILVNLKDGFDVIPAASGIPEMTRLSESQRMTIAAAVEEFGDHYDYMFIDTAAGIGDNVLHFNTSAEEIFVVVDPEPTSITDAYALIKVLSTRYDVKEFSILANSTPIGQDGRQTYAKLATATEKFLNVRLKFLGSISDDEVVSEAVIAQKPYLTLYPGSRASRDIKRLAQKVIEQEATRIPKGGVQFFFKDLLGS